MKKTMVNLMKPKVELELVWQCPRCKMYVNPNRNTCGVCGLEVEIRDINKENAENIARVCKPLVSSATTSTATETAK